MSSERPPGRINLPAKYYFEADFVGEYFNGFLRLGFEFIVSADDVKSLSGNEGKGDDARQGNIS